MLNESALTDILEHRSQPPWTVTTVGRSWNSHVVDTFYSSYWFDCWIKPIFFFFFFLQYVRILCWDPVRCSTAFCGRHSRLVIQLSKKPTSSWRCGCIYHAGVILKDTQGWGDIENRVIRTPDLMLSEPYCEGLCVRSSLCSHGLPPSIVLSCSPVEVEGDLGDPHRDYS